jgi:putative DNA primase/helicase
MNSASRNGHLDPLTAALAYEADGLSVIPIRRDGSKRPSCASWKPYQQEPADEAQVWTWFRGANPPGVAVVGGDVSGGLECLDFDAEAATTFSEWCALVEAEAPGLVARLSVAQTPKGGYHVRYRCPDMPIPGNMKLATDPAAKAVLIETRGEGGYALAPGCPAECHPTGRLYEHHSGPPLKRVQAIGIAERDLLIRCARSFDRSPPPEPTSPPTGRGPGLSPGDEYEQRGPDWSAILEPHGWVAVHQRGPVTYWRRPGKDGPGWSGTTGRCVSKAGRSLFYVFSANAAPFEPNKGYSRFACYALLNHGGDFSAAARALADQGYGDRQPRHRHQRGKDDDGTSAAPSGGGASPPGDVHLTDLGNARRIVRRHGRDLRYVHPWKTWLNWDGRRWAEDVTGEAVRRVKETQDALFRSAAEGIKALGDVGDDKAAAAEKARLARLMGHALKWEDARNIARSLDLARSEPCVPALPGHFDADPLLLNVLNGTLDLRTGQLRPHRREDLLTKLSSVNFDPAAACPLWRKFLDRIMGGNEDLIGYIQRVVGYGLSGDVSEQCMWFFHGDGANGKSTFIATALAMLGDYGMQAVGDLLMVKHNESHPTERADLCGKRFVATIETEEGKRMAEALMKQITGGDKMRARKMREDFFEFSPTFKIVLAANHKPQVRGTDHAVWRRIKLVPFTVTIPHKEQDKALPARLKKELPGILAWAVRGCLDWQRHGLGEPDEVRQATAQYQAEQDAVAQFLAECCIRQGEARVKVSALYDAYGRWSGDKFTTQPAFNNRVRGKGFESKRGTHGYFWHGLALAGDGGDGEAREPV